MTEQELRALVRSVIAQRNTGLADIAGASGPGVPGVSSSSSRDQSPRPAQHASHALFVLPVQGDACIIEPAVTCNHCGYCKSYGH